MVVKTLCAGLLSSFPARSSPLRLPNAYRAQWTRRTLTPVAEKALPNSTVQARASASPSLPSIGRPRSLVQSWVKLFDTAKLFGMTELESSVFAGPIRKDVMHRAVVYETGQRRGLVHRHQKSRFEVRGSRRKIRPQKGWGMARVRDRRSPLFRGGGRAFPRKDLDFRMKLPSKVLDFATRSALSTKYHQQQLHVVKDFNAENKEMKTHLEGLLTGKCPDLIADKDIKLMLVHDDNDIIIPITDALDSLEQKWLKRLTVVRADAVSAYQLLHHDHVLVSCHAVKSIEARLFAP